MTKRGELTIGFALLGLGLLWALKSLELTYMGDFAPGSGFLPFWLGVTLTILAVVFLVMKFRAVATHGVAAEEPASGWSKPVAIAGGFFVCVAVIGSIGFIAAVSLYLCFLLKIIERRTWTTSLAVGIGAPIAIFVLFKTWLGVPLPLGLFGL